MSERGMKKWNAYKSLPEHDPAIRGTMDQRYKVPRPVISSEEAEIINEILTNYHGELLEVEYYRNEELHNLTDTIKKIDTYSRKITFTGGTKISLNELTGLKTAK